MRPFTTLDAVACPLGLENVDTDQLIPARFMSRSRAQGYGNYLLHDLRFDDSGASRGFILDAPQHAAAEIVVARRNFGTGSSREAAVYALADYGIRCVIAPSFGDIFASNATKNGLLTAIVAAGVADGILEAVTTGNARLAIDLAAETITHGNKVWPFTIDPVRKVQLLNGWDDLDMTRRHAGQIARFAAERRRLAPWTIPVT